MKKLLPLLLGLSIFVTSAFAQAMTAPPKLVKFQLNNGNWYSTTTGFSGEYTCGVNKCYDIYSFFYDDVTEIQIRVDPATNFPYSETCWYYDHDGPTVDWQQSESGCLHYNNDHTWWYEDADISYWDYGLGDWAYAYGYKETSSSSWKYTWYRLSVDIE